MYMKANSIMNLICLGTHMNMPCLDGAWASKSELLFNYNVECTLEYIRCHLYTKRRNRNVYNFLNKHWSKKNKAEGTNAPQKTDDDDDVDGLTIFRYSLKIH